MNSTTYITLDMQAPETGVIAYAKQNDKLSRRLSATLKDGAVSWTPPTGAAAAIRYSKPDGTGGFYDVLEDSSPAIVVSGNVALMTLAEQCVTVPGQVRMELNFYTSAGAKLTSFTWLLNVEASVLADATIVSSSYYNVLTAQVAQTLGYRDAAANSATAAAASAALAQQISQQGKGWFATDTALKAAFPTGQNGWWAIVGAGDNIWTWDADTNAWVNTHTQTDLSNYYTKAQADEKFAPVAALTPTGAVISFAGTTAPNGWLLCDGTAVSRTAYAGLFNVIGTAFGAGDGSTTFNTPNMLGRVPLGSNSGFALGSTGGQSTHKHLNSFGFDGSNVYGATDASDLPLYGSELLSNTNRLVTSGAVSGGSARIAYTAESSTLQPYLAVNYIIKY